MHDLHRLGVAVQVDPMKPKLKPPGTKRLKLKCDILLSSSAFKLNLRHSSSVWEPDMAPDGCHSIHAYTMAGNPKPKTQNPKP